jgi:hypothetical protein
MLGITPRNGRVVLIGQTLWETAFARDPQILGRIVTLEDRAYTVVGVLPASFAFPDPESKI